jgi:hypothetical protein
MMVGGGGEGLVRQAGDRQLEIVCLCPNTGPGTQKREPRVYLINDWWLDDGIPIHDSVRDPPSVGRAVLPMPGTQRQRRAKRE